MNKLNEFNDLVRFSARRDAELMINRLEDGDITFRLTQLHSEPGTAFSWSKAAIIIQVANRDFIRAQAMLIDYRKTMGVPFN